MSPPPDPVLLAQVAIELSERRDDPCAFARVLARHPELRLSDELVAGINRAVAQLVELLRSQGRLCVLETLPHDERVRVITRVAD